MDSLEVNKVIASVLVAGIVFFIAGNIGDNLIRESIPARFRLVATPRCPLARIIRL